MRFDGDTRGQALQVGAVLILGFLVLALTLAQTQIVPAENKRTEFNHNLNVQNDLSELRNSLLRAGTTESVQPVSIKMGTTYSPRVFLINPPPPGGLVRNGSLQTVRIDNTTAVNNETRDYLNGSYVLSTKNVSYNPSYNVYQNAPITTFQTGVLVNEFDDGNDTAISGQMIIHGTDIYLVTIHGNISQAQVRTLNIDPQSLSTSTAATRIRDNSTGKVTLTIPTTLSEDRWRTLLSDEQNVDQVTSVPGRTAIEITLEEGTYRLRTAKVGVGTGATSPDAAYLTRIGSRNVTPLQGEELIVELRDSYNNPVDPSTLDNPVYVNVTTANAELVTPANATVGQDGRAAFTYVGNGSQINGSLLNVSVVGESGDDRWNVTFNITDRNGNQTGTQPPSNDPNNSSDIARNIKITNVRTQKDKGDTDLRIKFRNDNANTVVFQDARLDNYDEDNVDGRSPISEVEYRASNANTKTLTESGGFKNVDGPSISNGGTKQVTFDATGRMGNTKIESGDQIKFTIRLQNGDILTRTVTVP